MSSNANAALTDRSPDELRAFAAAAQEEYEQLRAKGLRFDLTRGKPAAEQLDLSEDMLRLPSGHTSPSGVDVRNYGGLEGLSELRSIFGELLGVDTAQLIAGGNSSLTMMRDTLVYLLLHGAVDSPRPWGEEETIRFICPVPGYDRHFAMLASFGIEMITVPMTDDGPDSEACAQVAAEDPSVKGMWVVPTYANPTGQTTAQEVAARLAAMDTAAPDFKILWDNAYALHHLTEVETKSADILALCSSAGHPNRAFVFASTSKITFAGAGVAFLASSQDQIDWWLGHTAMGSIGPDKINHLRHLEFFGSADGVRAHMTKHREIIAPKFAEVLRVLRERLGGLGIATWTEPIGGYFVSLDVLDGTASRVVELAKGAGVALTPAGSSYPHGKDPDNRNIRIAPTFPDSADVTDAMEAVATCVRLAAAEHLTKE